MNKKLNTTLASILPFFILLTIFLKLSFNPYFHLYLNTNNNNFKENIINEKTFETVKFFLYKGELDHEFYTPNEIDHMIDVRRMIIFLSFLFFGIFSLLAYIFYNLKKTKKLKPKLIIKSYTIYITSLLLLALIGFDFWFKIMHLFLFPQGNFTFSGDSNLIKLYTNTFFSNFTFYWLTIYFFIYLVLVYITYKKKINELIKQFF